MKPLLVDEVRVAVRGRWIAAGEPTGVRSVSTDSRHSKRGDLFIALRGANFDGHTFLAPAADAGCVGAIVALDAEIPPAVAGRFVGGVIAVADTTAALGDLAGFCRQHSPATVVGVTGSNGKTTVKRMIHAILSRKLQGSCSPKSFNNEIGLPLTLLDVEPADDYVVCEMGTNHPGEIDALCRIARPDVAVITSVAEAHLEGLGSLESVAREKAAILDRVPSDGLGVVWGDSEVLGRAVRPYSAKLIRFGASDSADLRLTAREPGEAGQRFQVNSRLWVNLPLPGRHNAINALAALGVAQRFGFAPEQAAEALANLEPAEMRMEWVDLGRIRLINDAYNANPGSVLAASEALRDFRAERRVLVLGDMRELGPQGPEMHRDVGHRIAEMQGADLVVGVGSLGCGIAQGASDAGASAEEFASVPDAIGGLASLLRDGDLVLLKGSRSMGMEALVPALRAAFGSGIANREESPT
jgi:UDP-N-acetylmuramoyl-tripeptide--D-alanyl-D-alanine ligase